MATTSRVFHGDTRAIAATRSQTSHVQFTGISSRTRRTLQSSNKSLHVRDMIASPTISHHPLSLQGQTHLHFVCRISIILHRIRATNFAIQSKAYHSNQNILPYFASPHRIYQSATTTLSNIIFISISTQETKRNVRIRTSIGTLQPPPLRPPQQTMRRLLRNRHLSIRH